MDVVFSAMDRVHFWIMILFLIWEQVFVYRESSPAIIVRICQPETFYSIFRGNVSCVKESDFCQRNHPLKTEMIHSSRYFCPGDRAPPLVPWWRVLRLTMFTSSLAWNRAQGWHRWIHATYWGVKDIFLYRVLLLSLLHFLFEVRLAFWSVPCMPCCSLMCPLNLSSICSMLTTHIASKIC